MENEQTAPVIKKKWYQTDLAAVLFLVFFFPVGLYLMWKYTGWSKKAKWIITGVVALFVVGSGASNSTTKTATQDTKVQPTVAQQSAVEQPTTPPQPTAIITLAPTKVTAKTTNTPVPTQKKQSAPVSNETVSQKNAVIKAKSYLSYTAFSHDGLVDQLEYEQFSHDDAVYGADNSGANWNEQAAKKAKSYMEMTGYSRGGLIDQLKYEKFTQEQAEYGANSVGL